MPRFKHKEMARIYHRLRNQAAESLPFLWFFQASDALEQFGVPFDHPLQIDRVQVDLLPFKKAVADVSRKSVKQPADAAVQFGDGDRLTVYSGRTEDLIGPLLEQYANESGTGIDVRYGDSGDLALLMPWHDPGLAGRDAAAAA